MISSGRKVLHMHSVIIVDDELFVRKGLQNMIDWKTAGFCVIGEADNGEDALTLIKAEQPDLVVTDIRMPVMDGLALIQAVAEAGLETEFIIISGYNDFRYAQQAVRFGVVDYVLKPVDQEDLLQALAKLHEQLAIKKQQWESKQIESGERQIEALLRGEVDETALRVWEEPWVAAGSKSFVYVLVEWNNVLPWNEATLPPKNELKAGIREVLQQHVPASPIPAVYEHRRAYGFIMPELYLFPFDNSLPAFLASLLITLERRFGLEFRAYAGENVTSLEQLNRSYTTAKDSIAYKFLKHTNKMIAYADIADIVLHYSHLNEDIYKQLMVAVEEYNEAEIAQCLERLFAEFVEGRYSPEAIKAAIMQCVLGIGKAIRGLQGDEKRLATIDPVIGWHDYNVTLEELRRMFEAFVMESADMLSQLYRTSGKSGIYKVKSYVDEHFHESINLKSIAAHFYMNTAYLGQLFRKSYGIYFNDYLLRLRIDEAKKLLRQSDMRVYEIAERVGFNKADYFVTQFEKLESMTPTEYRQRRN
jgi:two-component system response regulator YesN